MKFQSAFILLFAMAILLPHVHADGGVVNIGMNITSGDFAVSVSGQKDLQIGDTIVIKANGTDVVVYTMKLISSDNTTDVFEVTKLGNPGTQQISYPDNEYIPNEIHTSPLPAFGDQFQGQFDGPPPTSFKWLKILLSEQSAAQLKAAVNNNIARSSTIVANALTITAQQKGSTLAYDKNTKTFSLLDDPKNSPITLTIKGAGHDLFMAEGIASNTPVPATPSNVISGNTADLKSAWNTLPISNCTASGGTYTCTLTIKSFEWFQKYPLVLTIAEDRKTDGFLNEPEIASYNFQFNGIAFKAEQSGNELTVSGGTNQFELADNTEIKVTTTGSNPDTPRYVAVSGYGFTDFTAAAQAKTLSDSSIGSNKLYKVDPTFTFDHIAGAAVSKDKGFTLTYYVDLDGDTKLSDNEKFTLTFIPASKTQVKFYYQQGKVLIGEDADTRRRFTLTQDGPLIIEMNGIPEGGKVYILPRDILSALGYESGLNLSTFVSDHLLTHRTDDQPYIVNKIVLFSADSGFCQHDTGTPTLSCSITADKLLTQKDQPSLKITKDSSFVLDFVNNPTGGEYASIGTTTTYRFGPKVPPCKTVLECLAQLDQKIVSAYK